LSLGPGVEELARTFYRHHSRRPQEFIGSNLEDGLQDVASRPYWSRIWIVQEISLAREQVIWVGKQSIRGHTLLEFLHYLKIEFGLTCSTIATVVDYEDTLHAHGGTLRDHILRYGALECSDSRDHVYALLGLKKLSREGNQHNLDQPRL
jgi:hypothetical protein